MNGRARRAEGQERVGGDGQRSGEESGRKVMGNEREEGDGK